MFSEAIAFSLLLHADFYIMNLHEQKFGNTVQIELF